MVAMGDEADASGRMDKHHVFFCRFRVPAPVVLVEGVFDRETFTVVFSSFCTSSIARFYRVHVRNARGRASENNISPFPYWSSPS